MSTTTGSPDKPVRVVYPIPAPHTYDGASAYTPIVISYPPPRPRWITPVLWWGAGLIACLAWDRAVWLGVSSAGRPRLEWLEQVATFAGYKAAFAEAGSLRVGAIGRWAIGTLYAILYLAGRIYPWLLLAAVVIFRGWLRPSAGAARAAVRRGLLIAAVPALAGGLAELCKLLTRRGRPEVADGWYSFRAFWDRPFDDANIGMASSHAAVAFGAACVVGFLYPRARVVVWPLAVACAVARVLVGAHFVSDVYVAMLLAFAAFWLLRRADARLNPPARALS